MKAKPLTACREGRFLRMRRSCFSFPAHVPEHNFYRQLRQQPDLNFLYELTEEYYGRCGQQSIDPIVCFKPCLVGYLENRSTTASPLTESPFGIVAFGWACFTFRAISPMSRCHGTQPYPVPASYFRKACLSFCLIVL